MCPPPPLQSHLLLSSHLAPALTSPCSPPCPCPDTPHPALQDVCVSLWTKDHSHDLMYKVTDVCDPKDCPTPLDVKVEPYKGKYLFKDSRPGSRPEGPVRGGGPGGWQLGWDRVR